MLMFEKLLTAPHLWGPLSPYIDLFSTSCHSYRMTDFNIQLQYFKVFTHCIYYCSADRLEVSLQKEVMRYEAKVKVRCGEGADPTKIWRNLYSGPKDVITLEPHYNTLWYTTDSAITRV